MSHHKKYFWMCVLGMLLFLVGCLPPTAEPESPAGSAGDVNPTPTLAAGSVNTAEPTPAFTATLPPSLPALDSTIGNETYGFFIDFPSSYQVNEAVNDSEKAPSEYTFVVSEPATGEEVGFIDKYSFTIEVIRNVNQVTVADYAAGMPFSPAGTTVENVIEVNYNGITGLQQIENGLSGVGSMPVIQKVTYYAQGEFLYAVKTLGMTQEAFDSYLPLYEKMLTTFALVTPEQTAGVEPIAPGEFVTPNDNELIITQEESPYQDGWVVKIADGSQQSVLGEDGREYYYVRLSMSNPNTGQSWTVVEEWRPYGLGYDVPELFRWSGDGWSLFYTNVPRVDGCAIFVNGWDLHKFNFETGENTTIFEEGGFSLAMAPHEQAVAYGRGSTFSLFNINDSSVSQIELTGSIGAMAWAPDTRSVLVTVVENGCTPEMSYSFVRIDVGTNGVTAVLPATEQQLTIDSWAVIDEVKLRDQEGNLWLLNPTTGGLVSAADVQTGLPPAGLIYQSNRDIVQVTADGGMTVLAQADWMDLSPNGQRGAYFDYQADELVWVDLATGAGQVVGHDFYAVQQVEWMDNSRFLLGILVNEADMGPNNGYLTMYDIAQNSFTILDDSALMFSRPNAHPNGQTVAYDVGGQAMIYDLAAGTSTAFIPSAFAGWEFGEDTRLGSPAYSPDGSKLAWIIGGPTVAFGDWGAAVAIFDLQAQTVRIVGEYKIVGTDGWPEAPQWSPDGQWVAVQEWSIDRTEEGLWLYRTDGSARQHLGAQTAEVIWNADSSTLLFTRYAQDGERDHFQMDINSGEKMMFDLPGFARLLGWFN